MTIEIDEKTASEQVMAIAKVLAVMNGVEATKHYKVTYTATLVWSDDFDVEAKDEADAKRKAIAIMSECSYCTPEPEQVNGTYKVEEINGSD